VKHPRMPEGMHPGFPHPCFSVILFDEFADTAWIKGSAIAREKERLVINDVVLPVAVCQISLKRPFQLRHQGDGPFLFPLPFSHSQLIMCEVYIVNF